MDSLKIDLDGILGRVDFIPRVGLRIELAEFSQPLILTPTQILQGVNAMSDAYQQAVTKLKSGSDEVQKKKTNEKIPLRKIVAWWFKIVIMQCLHPIILPPSIAKDGHIIEARKVPCGKCAVCLRRKGREWYVRLKAEYEWHDGNAYFVTLTYSDWCLPTTKSGVQTVCKKDVQKFFKRLRRAIFPYKIRYFLISEYGEDTQRPHYHMIVYGFPHHQYDIVV